MGLLLTASGPGMRGYCDGPVSAAADRPGPEAVVMRALAGGTGGAMHTGEHVI
jgi:hypothetical protein